MQKSKLKKRLRKKHKVGEFQQYGFSIVLKIKDPNFDPIDDIINVVESENCACGGGGRSKYYSLSICSAKKFVSLTESDRDIIVEKLKNTDNIEEVVAGDMHDIWHMTDKDCEKEYAFYEEAMKKLGLQEWLIH